MHAMPMYTCQYIFNTIICTTYSNKIGMFHEGGDMII